MMLSDDWVESDVWVEKANQEEHDEQQGVIVKQLVMTIMSEFMMTHECSFEKKKASTFPYTGWSIWILNNGLL